MEAKHTPGAWIAKREGFSTIYIEAPIGGGVTQEVAACGPTADGPAQQEANAVLIAAAPELLEALQKIARMDYGNPYAKACADVARESILKATGETA